MVISNEADPTQMQLLGIHVHLEFELCLKSNLRDLKDSDSALFSQVSIMLPLHLSFFLVSCQLFFLVAIQVILDALSHDFFDIPLALRWVSDGFFRHHTEIIRHGNASLGCWHQTKRYLLLSVSFLF
jgi:hypothetical protein